MKRSKSLGVRCAMVGGVGVLRRHPFYGVGVGGYPLSGGDRPVSGDLWKRRGLPRTRGSGAWQCTAASGKMGPKSVGRQGRTRHGGRLCTLLHFPSHDRGLPRRRAEVHPGIRLVLTTRTSTGWPSCSEVPDGRSLNALPGSGAPHGQRTLDHENRPVVGGDSAVPTRGMPDA